MNSSNTRFTLDLHSAQSQISIPVLLGDTSRAFHINLSDGGRPYIIEDGCLAKLSIRRPTGTLIEDFCTIKNNTTIVYSFDQNENTAAVEGIHDCDVTLYGLDGQSLGSPRFSMVVNERVTRRDDLNVTDTEKTVIDAMIQAEASRQYAETLRVEAEEERRRIGQIASESAKNAKLSEDNAKASEESAKLSETNAKNSEESVSESAKIVREFADNAVKLDSRISRNDKRITNLEQGVPSDLFETDSGVAHIKAVPTNALPFAEITKLGGMTRKCANLLPAKDTDNFTTTADGANNSLYLYKNLYLNSGAVTISFNITKGANNTRNYPRLRTTDGSEQLYLGGGENENVNAGRYSYTFTVKVSGYYDLLWWDNGNTVKQTISKIMLNEGTTALSFEAYFEGYKSAKVTELKSNGKNMLDYRKARNSFTANGITFTNNGDGSFTVDGTATAQATYYIHEISKNDILPLKAGVAYTISGAAYGVGICVYDENWKVYNTDSTKDKTFTLTYDSLKYGFYLYVAKGKTLNNVTVYPQLEIGSMATEFRAYNGVVDTFAFPSEVQALDGYGESNPGNAEEYNHIDFEQQKFVAYGHIVNGSWVAFGTVQETDISDLISEDNFIEVESNGTITAVNENSFAVPSEITYMLKEVAV